jgi:hypothetical protein
VEGCRGRVTPASLRFLGRKIYLGFVVVLVAAMEQGAGLTELAGLVGVSRRTVERWRVWWRTLFARSPFWRGASGQFMPKVSVSLLPAMPRRLCCHAGAKMGFESPTHPSSLCPAALPVRCRGSHEACASKAGRRSSSSGTTLGRPIRAAEVSAAAGTEGDVMSR